MTLETGHWLEVGNAMNVEDNVTIVIKTFQRPYCLQSLVRSIRKFYQRIRIVVTDDSREQLSPVFPEISEYYHMPYGSGLSAGRNLALEKVKTRYFLLADDDHVFTRKTSLEKLSTTLEQTSFGIVSCNVVECLKSRMLPLGVNPL